MPRASLVRCVIFHSGKREFPQKYLGESDAYHLLTCTDTGVIQSELLDYIEAIGISLGISSAGNMIMFSVVALEGDNRCCSWSVSWKGPRSMQIKDLVANPSGGPDILRESSELRLGGYAASNILGVRSAVAWRLLINAMPPQALSAKPSKPKALASTPPPPEYRPPKAFNIFQLKGSYQTKG